MTRRWLAVPTLASALAVLGFLAITSDEPDTAKAALRSLAQNPVTVRVELRPERSVVALDGELLAPKPQELLISSEAEGSVITGVQVASGKPIAEGEVVGSIEGTAVVALQGEIPSYRDLRIGDSGPDVEQLFTALRRLGIACACAGKLAAADRAAVATRLYGIDPKQLEKKVVLPAASVAWAAALPMTVGKTKWSTGGKVENPVAVAAVEARRVRVDIAGQRVPVKLGMKTTVQSATSPEPLGGKVIRVDLEGGTFSASIPATRVKGSNLPVSVNVTTLSRRRKVPALPVAAIKIIDEHHGVVAVPGSDGTTKQRSVRLGPDLGGWVEIKRGLRAGDRVVIGDWTEHGRGHAR